MPTILPLNHMQNNTHKILLVDASGSMQPYEKETQDTIYSIIKELQKNTHLTLVFFDTVEYQIIVDSLISNIRPELAYLYKANGGTPITDSIYKAVQDITNDIKDIEQLNEEHKFFIWTDGVENSSKFVKSTDLGRLIKHFTDNFHWDFQFIGPKSQEQGIKAYTDSINIPAENVTLFANITEGLKEMKEKTIS